MTFLFGFLFAFLIFFPVANFLSLCRCRIVEVPWENWSQSPQLVRCTWTPTWIWYRLDSPRRSSSRIWTAWTGRSPWWSSRSASCVRSRLVAPYDLCQQRHFGSSRYSEGRCEIYCNAVGGTQVLFGVTAAPVTKRHFTECPRGHWDEWMNIRYPLQCDKIWHNSASKAHEEQNCMRIFHNEIEIGRRKCK